MRFLFAPFLLIASTIAHAQHIFGHSAQFSGGPLRHEVQGELTTIDVDPPCEVFMLIEVDRKGKVVSAKLDPIAPSCSDTTVLGRAFRSVRARVFNADPKAPARQEGRVHWSYNQPERDQLDMNVAVPDMEEDDRTVYESTAVEVAPQFPGGKANLDKYIAKFLQYPEDAKAAKTEGTVLISFIVEKDGMLSTFTLEKGAMISLNQEAMRVSMHMPKWIPGLQNGKPVRTRCELPIVFKQP